MFCAEGVLSDSEEDKGPEAVAQQNTTSVWSSKQSTEQGGYSSEASSERGERERTAVSYLILFNQEKLQECPGQDSGNTHAVKHKI